MANLDKLAKVSENMTINRCDNGFMIEVSGRNKQDNYTNAKIVCNTEDELFGLIKEFIAKELDN